MTHTRKPLAALALAALAVALAACGGGSTKSDGKSGSDGRSTVQTIALEAKEYSFGETDIEAKAGKVKVELTNAGVVEHDFSIEGLNFKVLAAAAKKQSGTTTLRAGTYTFFCSIPGHREQGMTGTLTVS